LQWLTNIAVVELDLTSPAMIPGKKAFDRLMYASKNAFGAPVTWLFQNMATTCKQVPPSSRPLD
jgi:ribonucleases P/MRP protein subunit RPP40